MPSTLHKKTCEASYNSENPYRKSHFSRKVYFFSYHCALLSHHSEGVSGSSDLPAPNGSVFVRMIYCL